MFSKDLRRGIITKITQPGDMYFTLQNKLYFLSIESLTRLAANRGLEKRFDVSILDRFSRNSIVGIVTRFYRQKEL